MAGPSAPNSAKPNSGAPQAGVGPVVDPTKNVLDLVEAANKRQDDLRAADKELTDAKISSLTETIKTFAAHQRELDRGESDRLNSIRQVDREEVTKTAAANQAAITTLATSTATLAETLRTQVAVTASAAESRQSASAQEMTKRLSALELSASASMGKQTVADPQMAELMAEMRSLTRTRASDQGQKQGLADGWKLLIAALGAFALLQGLGVFDRAPTPPQVIYTPAPAGTQLPSTPPAQVPR